MADQPEETVNETVKEEKKESEEMEARPAQFAALEPKEGTVNPAANVNLLMDVKLRISVELGRTEMFVRDLLNLGIESVVELNKLSGEPVEILVNDKLFAKGEVVVVEDNFGVRITEILSPKERINNLR
jgi:flagellar motor switch protein FliN